jgi:hypothetical protein
MPTARLLPQQLQRACDVCTTILTVEPVWQGQFLICDNCRCAHMRPAACNILSAWSMLSVLRGSAGLRALVAAPLRNSMFQQQSVRTLRLRRLQTPMPEIKIRYYITYPVVRLCQSQSVRLSLSYSKAKTCYSMALTHFAKHLTTVYVQQACWRS